MLLAINFSDYDYKLSNYKFTYGPTTKVNTCFYYKNTWANQFKCLNELL